MHDGMPYDPIQGQGQGHETFKVRNSLIFFNFQNLSPPAFFNASWQMTTDSETTEQYLTFVWSRFLISVPVFVSRDFELGRVSVQFANAFAIAITFTRRRRHSEATAVTYGTIFVVVPCYLFNGICFHFHLASWEFPALRIYTHTASSSSKRHVTDERQTLALTS